MEDEDRLWKLVHSCSEVIHTLSKNIYCRAVPQSLRRSERANVFFEIPEDITMPLDVFVALHRQLDNIRKVGKVLEKTNQIERSLKSMELQCDTGDFMENDSKFYQSLHQFLVTLNRCDLLLRRRSSVMKRVTPPTEDSVIVHPIVRVHEPVLNVDISEDESYRLVNNSDPKTWKVIDADGKQREIASLFLEVDVTRGEQATVQRLRERLIKFINLLVIRCSTVMIKIIEKIQEEHELLSHFNLEGAEKVEFQRSINQVKASLDAVTGNNEIFHPRELKRFLARVYVLESDLAKMQLEDNGESTNMYIRLVKLTRLLGVLQILLNLQRLSLTPQEEAKMSNGTRSKSRGSLNSLILDVRPEGTFRSIIEFNFEMVEDVREDEIRITHPWDDTTSDTASVSSSISDFTTTESVIRSTGEIRRRYLIKGVFDSANNAYTTLGDAVRRGIILYRKGAYVDNVTGQEIPVERAMIEGKIQVEKTTSRKLREDTSSYGIITLKHVHTPAKPFVVRSVIHPATGKEMTLEQASTEGVIDEDNSIYRDSVSGYDLQVRTAVDRGLITIEEDETTESAGEQSTSTSYAIHGVVDKKLRRIVSFAEAAELGLIDRETGSYVDNETGEKHYPTEAIRRGFFKGRAIDDPEDTKIDPRNRIVVERFKRLRTKWASVRAFMKIAAIHRQQRNKDENLIVRTESVSSQ